MTTPERHDRSEIGHDPLDVQVAPLRPFRIADVLGRTRAAFGLRPLAAPALLFVPLGAMAGPLGAGLITVEALGFLYPVISVALSALGVFVGMGLRARTPGDRRWLAFGSIEALVTIVAVAAACAWLFGRWGLNLEGQGWQVALVLGICASATSAGLARPDDPPQHHVAMRIADFDDVLPIVLGGLVLALWAGASSGQVALLAALNVAVPLAIAVAGWLLFERAHDEAERGVFAIGIIALIGGSAAYLGVSPLLAGMVAGAFWRHSPGKADEVVAADLKRLQHPLVVLLLIAAGATAVRDVLAVWIAGAYVLARMSGKQLGGWLVSRATAGLSPADLGSYLLPPGVIGLAFALSFHLSVLSSASAAVLTAVALGTLASEVLAALALLGPARQE